MCCGSASQKPSDVLAEINAKRTLVKKIPTPLSSPIKSNYQAIPKEIKQQLLMAQQHARIQQKKE